MSNTVRTSGPSRDEPGNDAPRPAGGGLLGLFRDPDGVADALDALRKEGFDEANLEVLSDAPYPEGAFGEQDRGHRLYVFTIAGAVIGGIFGLLLVIGTQMAYPLVTGGKPILAIPPMVNVVFETTMLGAIFFTALGVLLESRLPDLDPQPYDPRISEGMLGLAVSHVDGKLEVAERAMRDKGAVDIVRSD
jgi:hypothetical protein